MPTVLDVAFVFTLLVLVSIVEYLVFWPRFRADIAAGKPEARVRGYSRGVAGQWLFTVAAVVIWVGYQRSAAALRLTAPDGWRLWASIGLVLIVAALAVLQLRSVHRLSPGARVAARPQLGKVEFMLPHSRAEYRWFLALSATAGVCEELLYRGYLTWFLTPWLGVGGAFAAVVALFGIGHAYQGRRGAVRATVAGAVMSAVVLLTGWLLPAMIIHAMVDASSGTAGYWLLRESGHSGSGAESRTGEETSPRAEMAAETV